MSTFLLMFCPAELLRHKFKRDGLENLHSGPRQARLRSIRNRRQQSALFGSRRVLLHMRSHWQYWECGDPRPFRWQLVTIRLSARGRHSMSAHACCTGTTVKPCASLEADTWINFQIHVNTITSVLEVWQTVRGKTLKIIDFQLQGFPMPPAQYEWIKLTPYNTGKDTTEVSSFISPVVSAGDRRDRRSVSGHRVNQRI